MSGETSYILELLYTPVQVNLEKLEPSLVELCLQRPVKMDELSKLHPQLSQCITDQPDDQKHLVRTDDVKDDSRVFPKPPCHLGVVLILILENSTSKGLTLFEICDRLIYLFPYFRSVVCSGKSWRSKIRHTMSIEEYKRLFIIEKKKGTRMLYVHLDPSMRNVSKKLVRENLQRNYKEFKASISQPHLLKMILRGRARHDSGSNTDNHRKNQAGRERDFASIGDLLKMFLRGRARLDSGSNTDNHRKNQAGKENDFGNVGGKSFPEISGPRDKTGDRMSKLNEESGAGNYLVNNDSKVSERLNCETYVPDCSQSIEGCSKSSGSVKLSLSSSRVDALVNIVDSDTGDSSLQSENFIPHNGNQSQQVLSCLGETPSSLLSESFIPCNGNQSQQVLSCSGETPSSLPSENFISHNGNQSQQVLSCSGETPSSLPNENFIPHNGNQSQQVLSCSGETPTTAQPQLDTVGKNSLDNLVMVEDSVSCVDSKVNTGEDQMLLATSESEENVSNSSEIIKGSVSQGTKRKENNLCKVNMKSKSLPSEIVHSDTQNVVISSEEQRKLFSLEELNSLEENSVIDKDNTSKGLPTISQQCKTLPLKLCLNNFQKCIEGSISTHFKHLSSTGMSGKKTREAGNSVYEDSHNKDNLPVITDTSSISNITENDEDNNIIHLELTELGMPVIKDVTSLATSNEEEKVNGSQHKINEVSESSNSNYEESEKSLPVILSVEDKAFHMWTPNELGLNESSSLIEDGKQLQVMGKKGNQNIYTSGTDHTCISDINISDKESQMNSHNVVLQVATTQLAPPINKSNETSTDDEAVKFVKCVPSGNYLNATNMTLIPNLKPKMSSCSAGSAAHIVGSNSTSQRLQLSGNAAIPKVSSCIDAWQKVFPWMLYSESDQSFICKECEWGNKQFKSCIVFTLRDPTDVYSVAQQLRFHRETDSHKAISKKRDMVLLFFQLLYPVLKHHMFRCFNNIIEDVTLLSGGNFPGPQESPQKEFYTSYMIKHIAECVEVNLLKSLAKSPVFSIVAVEEKKFAILRWLNHKGEAEEHFFSSQICCPGEVIPIVTYLKKRQVDTTKLISYSHFPNTGTNTMPNAETSPLPVRYPPLKVCIKWLQKTDLLRNLFSQLETLTRVFKSFFRKFSIFPVAVEMVRVEEPFSHGCVVNEKIVEFYFNSFNELKKICVDIYNETGNSDALGFSRAELTNFRSVQDFVSLLPKLHRLFIEKNCDYSTLSKLIKDFRSLICAKKALEGLDSNMCIALSLLDIYLSHTIISLQSQEQGIGNIFTLKLRQVTTKDLQKILSKFIVEYPGGSIQCLQNLHALRMQLSKNRDCLIFELLADLIKKPELCQVFPHLLSLYHKITVLPFLHAKKEQYMFNLAVLEVFLNGKFKERLISPLSLILLEGPSVAEIDVDQLLDLWSKKWKSGNAKR